jgi:uncharacterized protein (DUF1810 family)
VTEPDLVRFIDAKASVYQQVVEELTKGRKRTHWMWFIFPQLAGLGHSPMAQHYAIRDLDQAKRYLANPILGGRLRVTSLVRACSQGSWGLDFVLADFR